MFHAQLFYHIRWEDPGSKGPPEDVRELLVQTSYAHLVEVPVRTDEGLVGGVTQVTAN